MRLLSLLGMATQPIQMSNTATPHSLLHLNIDTITCVKCISGNIQSCITNIRWTAMWDMNTPSRSLVTPLSWWALLKAWLFSNTPLWWYVLSTNPPGSLSCINFSYSKNTLDISRCNVPCAWTTPLSSQLITPIRMDIRSPPPRTTPPPSGGLS